MSEVVRWLRKGCAALHLAGWAAAAAAGPGGVYRVPYRLSETKHLLVRAKLNGQGPYTFILDTGAPALFVSEDVAGKLGVKPGGNEWARFSRLEIEGGVVVEPVDARVADPFQLKGMNALGLPGVELAGVLGYNVLARYRMAIDLKQPVMTWTRLDHEPPPPAALDELNGGEPVKPPENLQAMEGFTKLATALLPKRQPDQVLPRGFFGMELRPFARVEAVLPGSPAALAGLRPGDRITAVTLGARERQRVRGRQELQRLATGAAAGTVARFTVRRAGRERSVVVRAGEGGL